MRTTWVISMIVFAGSLFGCGETVAVPDSGILDGEPAFDASDAGCDADCGDAGPNDSSLTPAVSGAIGTHHITEFFEAQARLEETEVAFIRINVGGNAFRRYTDDPEGYDWTRLDNVVASNPDRQLLVTIYPRHASLSSTTTPPIPVTEEDRAAFAAFVDAAVARWGDGVEYWQLDNEVDLSSHWPSDRYADYAELLALFRDTIHAREPEARIVVAGFAGGANPSAARVGSILTEVNGIANPRGFDIDIHHHRAWHAGAQLGERIRAFSSALEADFSALSGAAILVTENSTWLDEPVDRDPQTAAQQAVYAVESIYTALEAGARVCVFGTLMDRIDWMGTPTLHRFNLNGLFYNESKTYTDGAHTGPKAVAFTLRLLLHLTEGLDPADIASVPSGVDDVTRFDVGGPRPHTVLWWTGASGSASIDVESSESVLRVLDTVPTATATWPPIDPEAGFPTEELPVIEGRATVHLAPHLPRVIPRSP